MTNTEKNSEFLRNMIDWMHAMLCVQMKGMADWHKPSFVPCKIRMKIDVNYYRAGTNWGRVASVGDEVDCETTVYGVPAIVVNDGADRELLRYGDFEVIDFAFNKKKHIPKG